MKAAACSWRVTTTLIADLRRDSRMSRVSSPGKPKIYSTPSSSSWRAKRSDAFIGGHLSVAFQWQGWIAENHKDRDQRGVTSETSLITHYGSYDATPLSPRS